MGLLWLKRIDPLSALIPRWLVDSVRVGSAERRVSGVGNRGAAVPEVGDRLVILRPGGLGDFVLLTHAAARVQLQQSEVVWIGEGRNAVWPRFLGLECHCYDELRFNLRVLLGRLGAMRMVCTEQTFGLAAVWGRRGCASDGIYYGYDSNRRADLFERKVAYSGDYELDCFTRLLSEASGRAAVEPLPPERLCAFYGLDLPSLRGAGRSLLGGHEGASSKEGVRIVALAGMQLEGKRLSVREWRSLLGKARGSGSEVVLIGMPADRPVANEITAGFGQGTVRNLVGQLSFKEVATVVAGADRLYSVDSGLVHVAEFFGVPSEVMFPVGSSRKWGPRVPGSRVIEADGIAEYLEQP